MGRGTLWPYTSVWAVHQTLDMGAASFRFSVVIAPLPATTLRLPLLRHQTV